MGIRRSIARWFRRRNKAPSLRGNPRVPEGAVVYAIGDIHGERALLQRLLTKIEQDAESRTTGQSCTVVFLGDYVDRGPDSKGVLDLLTTPPSWGASYRFLRGNHEDALLAFLSKPDESVDWLRFGGAETLASYGIMASPGITGAERCKALARTFQERLPTDHLRFLRQTELMISIGDYLFVHAGIRYGTPIEQQDPHDVMWIREGFIDADPDEWPVVVHGHTIVNEPVLTPHRIAIDTGAYATGVLTALALRDDERHLIQEIAD